MLCWWKHRNNGMFLQQDSGRILEVLHESGEMDLSCEEGRLIELGTYWMLVFICAHDSWLWDVRDYWEHALLKWRVAHYYCHEHHFSVALLRNEGLCPTLGAATTENVDLVVTQNYAKRFPGSIMPATWARVTFDTLPPSAMSSPNWEVRDGGVYITFRDFVPWAWHQMVRATDEVNRRILVARWDDSLDADRLMYDQDLRDFLSPFLSRCEHLHKEEREAVRTAQARYVDPTLPPVGNAEEVLRAVKSRFPLCMLQHFWLAFDKGRHPKHHSRVALAKFLLEAGYNVQQVDGIMFSLFSLDKDFTSGYGAGGNGWNEVTYRKKFGAQVADMHRKAQGSESKRAYGCGALIRSGLNNEARGCPYFKKAPGASKDVAVMLDWAGVPMADIEDIAGKPVGDALERCQCDFNKRSLLRDAPYFVMRHPNSYMRGYNKFTGSTTSSKPKDEI